MTYSKSQHNTARQQAANLIAEAVKILKNANEQAKSNGLWSCLINETGDAYRNIEENAKYTLPAPEAKNA